MALPLAGLRFLQTITNSFTAMSTKRTSLPRPATAADIDTIITLRMELLNEVTEEIPVGLEQKIRAYLEQHLENGSCLCALLEADGQAVSCAMLCLGESVPDEINTAGKFAMLASVYTRPEYRSRGYMTGLLTTLFDWGREAEVKEVYITAEEKAIPLYRRLGFVPMERGMVKEL